MALDDNIIARAKTLKRGLISRSGFAVAYSSTASTTTAALTARCIVHLVLRGMGRSSRGIEAIRLSWVHCLTLGRAWHTLYVLRMIEIRIGRHRFYCSCITLHVSTSHLFFSRTSRLTVPGVSSGLLGKGYEAKRAFHSTPAHP